MKKKIVTIALVVALVATCFAGTLAYLTDKDAAVNVMAMGNVKIEQIEQERGENGELVPFTPNKPAYPIVGEDEYAEDGAPDNIVVNGIDYTTFTMKNVVDKIITVKNNGNTDAYVRTIIAIEAPDYDPTDLIGISWNSYPSVCPMSGPYCVEFNGVKWVCFVFTYTEALIPEQVSAPSLLQVYLDNLATNEDCAKFGDTWEILALTQGVQAAGFETAGAALDEAFGEVTTDNLIDWFTTVING